MPAIDYDAQIFQLTQENEELKQQLAILEARRSDQDTRMSTFTAQAEAIDQWLPQEVKDQHYLDAFDALHQISGNAESAFVTSVAESGALTPNGAFLTSAKAGSSSAARSSDIEISQLTGVLDNVREVYQVLTQHTGPAAGSPKRKSSPQDQLQTSLQALEQHSTEFPVMLTTYLNGRNHHLSKNVRAQIKNVIGGFFCEASVLHRLTNELARVIENVLKLEEKDVEGLAADELQKPLVEVLGAVIEVLEETQGANPTRVAPETIEID